jgi:hypothetical protein
MGDMAFRADDLTDLFLPSPPASSQDLRFRQGVVVAWNQETAENVVHVGGTDLVNLPVLNTSEAISLSPGDVVGIIVAGSTMAVLGRLTIPGTPAAASALDAFRGKVLLSEQIVTDTVSPFEDTSSGTFTDLATVGPTCTDVLISATGRALVIVSCNMATPDKGGIMGFEVSGATSLPADITRSVGLSASGTTSIGALLSRVIEVPGLTPGLNTFTAKYERTSGVTAVGFQDRNLTVIPL